MQTGATRYHAELGLLDNGSAIKRSGPRLLLNVPCGINRIIT